MNEKKRDRKVIAEPSSSQQEMIPLNSELYSDFSIDELEERLEMAQAWICVHCEGGGNVCKDV